MRYKIVSLPPVDEIPLTREYPLSIKEVLYNEITEEVTLVLESNSPGAMSVTRDSDD